MKDASFLLSCGLSWPTSDTAAGTTAPLSLPPVTNPAGFADLVAKVKPAIVNIAATEKFGQSGDQAGPDDGSQTKDVGSGFVIDPAGFIVTNNHVIAAPAK